MRTFEELGDRHGVALALHDLAIAKRVQGYLTESLTLEERVSAVVQQIGDRGMQSSVARSIGQLHLLRGDQELAAQHLTRALGIARSLGAKRLEGQALFRIGQLHLRQGQLDRAKRAFETVLELTSAVRDRRGRAMARLGLGQVHLRQGRHEQAHSYLALARSEAAEIRNAGLLVPILHELGRLSHARDEPARRAIVSAKP